MTAPDADLPPLRRRPVSALGYYLSSLPVLLLGVRNPLVLLSLLRPGGPPRLVRLRDGSRFWVRTAMEAWVVKETCLDRAYEVAGTALRRGWRVVDVGAGIGDFVVLAAHRTRGVVHAYEPAAASVALLTRNVQLNGAAEVTVFPTAVGAEPGTRWLDTRTCQPLLFRTTGERSTPAPGLQPVETVSLAEVVERLPSQHCDFLKMDCEGAELEIVLGTDPGVLAAIDRLCLEYHDFRRVGEHHDMATRLAELGRDVRLHPSPVHRDTGILYSEHPRVRAAG